MEFSVYNKTDKIETVSLIIRTFSDSEGRAEGETIGQLVAELVEKTDPLDILGYTARENATIIAAIFLSRLQFEEPAVAFMLSPVAVHSDYQGRGIGQQLIKLGLAQLKEKNVELVFTYGDPNYYAKVGFEAVPADTAKAPFTLSQPHGWLWQELTDRKEKPRLGASRCVAAFNHPEYW